MSADDGDEMVDWAERNEAHVEEAWRIVDAGMAHLIAAEAAQNRECTPFLVRGDYGVLGPVPSGWWTPVRTTLLTVLGLDMGVPFYRDPEDRGAYQGHWETSACLEMDSCGYPNGCVPSVRAVYAKELEAKMRVAAGYLRTIGAHRMLEGARGRIDIHPYGTFMDGSDSFEDHLFLPEVPVVTVYVSRYCLDKVDSPFGVAAQQTGPEQGGRPTRRLDV